MWAMAGMRRRSALAWLAGALGVGVAAGEWLGRRPPPPAPAASGGTAALDIRQCGAKGDGKHPDDLAFKTALDSLREGGTLLLSRGAYRLSRPLTVPASIVLRFEIGALLAPDAGVPVRVEGPLEAGLWPIFSGSVQLAGPLREAYPQWFGARGDGSHDDAPALQAAIDSVAGSGIRVFVPPGHYRLRSTIRIRQTLDMEGVLGDPDTLLNGTVFLVDVPPGQNGFELADPRGIVRFLTWRNLAWRKQHAAVRHLIAMLSDFNQSYWERCAVVNAVGGDYHDVVLENSDASFFTHCYFLRGAAAGRQQPAILGIYGTGHGTNGIEMLFVDCHIASPGRLAQPPDGVYISRARVVRFVGCQFDSLRYPLVLDAHNAMLVGSNVYNCQYNWPLVREGTVAGPWAAYGTYDRPGFQPSSNAGVVTLTGNGARTYAIAHGLPAAPRGWSVTPASDGPTVAYVAADATHLRVTLTSPLQPGQSLRLSWLATV